MRFFSWLSSFSVWMVSIKAAANIFPYFHNIITFKIRVLFLFFYKSYILNEKNIDFSRSIENFFSADHIRNAQTNNTAIIRTAVEVQPRVIISPLKI